MLTIDGSHGEGGGQMLRTALAMSTLTFKPFEMTNIRKGRCVSGLKPQHLFCIKALEEMSGARVENAKVGCDNIMFAPHKLKSSTISIDIGTAGSVTLLMQAVLPAALFGEKKTRFRLKGGTDTKWSMPIDYFSEVLLPQLRKYADIDFKLERRGYYPAGNGQIDITIKPKFRLTDYRNFEEFWENVKEDAPKINLIEQGKLMQIKGVSHASADLQDSNVAERQAKSAQHILTKLNCPVHIRSEYSNTMSTGSGITLWAIFKKEKDEDMDAENPIRIGSDALGEKGKRAEDVGKEAAERLLNEISYNAPVDEYLADNLIPIMAIVGGKIKIAKISNHAHTNIFMTEQFLGKIFKVNEHDRVIETEY